MNQQPKALISARAKKFIPSHYLLLTFISKAYNNLQGVFPTMIGFVTLGHLFFRLLIHSQTSWPYLISELLVACSSWPRTFFTPQVFLFSICMVQSNQCDTLSLLQPLL